VLIENNMKLHVFSTLKRHLGGFSAALVILLSIAAGHGQTYSISGDYSSTTNPTGVWSYGWIASLGASLNLYTVNFSVPGQSGSNSAWNSGGGSTSDPAFGNNSSGTTYVNGDFTEPTGWAFFAPGVDDTDLSDVRFTAPNAGSYNLNLAFEGAQSEPTDTDVYVFTNGSDLYSANVDGFGGSSEQTYNGTVSLTAGQTVEIAVGHGPGQSIGNYDNTNVQGTITAVPEPSTWGMLIVGAGSMLGFLHRRRR